MNLDKLNKLNKLVDLWSNPRCTDKRIDMEMSILTPEERLYVIQGVRMTALIHPVDEAEYQQTLQQERNEERGHE